MKKSSTKNIKSAKIKPLAPENIKIVKVTTSPTKNNNAETQEEILTHERLEELFNLPDSTKRREVIYVLQGGGALGTYQVGACEALDEHGYCPDMVVGISVGAINAAIIAGNPPENRIQKLYAFWDKVCTKIPFPMLNNLGLSKLHHWYSASTSLMCGQPGFFVPRFPNPWFLLEAAPDQLSFYDTTALYDTLLELVDFKYLNEGHVRLCLGSVELASGEFIFFDNRIQEITPKHIMASGALPPGFPPVEIDGKYYVDGGVYSNTPLSKVIDEFADKENNIHNVLCFMIDLFSARGALPHSIDGLLERVKDIQYSSHSKRASALYATTQNLSHAIHFLTSKLTKKQLSDPKVQEIVKLGFAHRMDIIRLVYRSDKGSELHNKDYEFSAESANIHRQMGYDNTVDMIKSEEKKWMQLHQSGVTVYTADRDAIIVQKL